MTNKPLFLIFVNTTLSYKLINQIIKGFIDAYIYTTPELALQLKKVFITKMSNNSRLKIIPTTLPFSYDYFNVTLTSRSFWDNIPINYSTVFVLYNPRSLALTINFANILKNKLPFGLIPMVKDFNFDVNIRDNPAIIDEQMGQGFLFYINSKYARNTIKRFKKSNILNIRKRFNMKNNEHIERLNLTPFYLYFYHFMQSLDYNTESHFTISRQQS